MHYLLVCTYVCICARAVMMSLDTFQSCTAVEVLQTSEGVHQNLH